MLLRVMILLCDRRRHIANRLYSGDGVKGEIMEFWSDEQCENWCAGRYLAVGPNKSVSISAKNVFRARFELSADPRRLEAVSQMLRDCGEFSSGSLLWVTDWGAFFSEQNNTIFASYRATLGEERSLIAAAGHFVQFGELNELGILIYLCLLFSWDCWLISSTRALVCSLDHHQRLEFVSTEEDIANFWRELCSEYELRRID